MSDLIDRQAVLDMVYDMSEIDGEHFNSPCFVVDVDDIKKLPSATPIERTGHWIKSNPLMLSECSECGNKAFGYHGFDEVLTDFCPNCGADMRGDAE